MNNQVPCPNPEDLSKLLTSRLPDAEEAKLAAHVDHCESCQKTLDALTAGGAIWPDAARLAIATRAPEPALKRAMQNLSDAPPTVAQAVETEDPANALLPLLTPPDSPDHLGRLGPYAILSVLGSGGMGVVLRAYDATLQRDVAIKVLAPELASNVTARRRFMREAAAAAGINHENVVTIHAVDEISGLPCIVMQYIAGRSLYQRLEAAEPMEIAEIVWIGRQIAAGLGAAHARGIIHRDIKPANILLEAPATTASGPTPCELLDEQHGCGPVRLHERVRITDFGLARAIDDASLSQSGIVAGTPLYMSPEQFSGTGVDQRSDLYALGVLLYRMATGREPFIGEEVNSLRTQHLYERPKRPSEAALRPIPNWLDELILQLLQKDPAARPSSAEEVICSLDAGLEASQLPPDEEARLSALRRYRILDTDPEQNFDDLTYLASYVCGTPFALITLVDADRQWFKAKVGMSLQETARDISFCTHTIREVQPLVVRDALEDKRFANSPLVRSEPHVRFYAGIPILTPDGHALGALCVFDRVPRQLHPDQVSALAALSRLVMAQLELRRNLLELKDAVGPEAA
jgi:serine/threonine protein kinase